MDIEINKMNEHEIVAALKKAAGRATYTTTRDWDAFEKAFKAVQLDIARRFRVPDDVDMRAIFTGGGASAKVSELTFRRVHAVWYLEEVRSKRTSCPTAYIKYRVCSYSYEKFWIYVKDGRSMKSVERKDDRPLSQHKRLAIMSLQAQRSKPRTRTKPNG